MIQAADWPRHAVARFGELPDPGACEFLVGSGDWPFRGVVIRLDGRLYAYANICPHKLHPLNAADDGFFVHGERLLRCASHQALFDPESGLCVAGPCAGQRLAALACGRDGELVWVQAPDASLPPGTLRFR
jgi:nitrite reductase/ring-hydroxylating ferredoxin subunit